MKKILACLLLAFLTAIPNTYAQDNEDTWEFYVAPAFWVAGIDSNVAVGGVTVSGESDFEDIIVDLKGGLMGGFGVRIQREPTGRG